MPKIKSSSPRVAVFGAGPAGLYAAQLLVREGARVALFESHSKAGGCASFFGKKTPSGRAVFDAGATLLDGFQPQGVMRRLSQSFGVELPAFEPVQRMMFRLGAGEKIQTIETATPEIYRQSLAQHFPRDAAFFDRYWPQMQRNAEALTRAFHRLPHLPLRTFADVRNNLSALGQLNRDLGPAGIARLGWGQRRSLADDLARYNVSDELRRWIEMTLLITLQAPASEVYPAYAALALMFYPYGVGCFRGGMRALFDALLKNLEAKANARVFMRSRVQSVEAEAEGYVVTLADQTRQGPFDAVFTSVPRYNASPTWPRPLHPRSQSWDAVGGELWSAYVGYLAVQDDPSYPEEAFHAHSSRVANFEHAHDGGDIFASFSSRLDVDRAPSGLRVVTVSTHTRPNPERWRMSPEYRQDKAETCRRALRTHFDELFPASQVVFEDYGTPKTFVRYTQREGGTVGGIPLAQSHSLFRAPSQRTLLPNVYQIGDTAFPGQSVYATALGACAAVEKFLDRKIVI